MFNNSSKWVCPQCRCLNAIHVNQCTKCFLNRHRSNSPGIHRPILLPNQPIPPTIGFVPQLTAAVDHYYHAGDDRKSNSSASEQSSTRSSPLSTAGKQEKHTDRIGRNANPHPLYPPVGEIGASIASGSNSICPYPLSTRLESPSRSNGTGLEVKSSAKPGKAVPVINNPKATIPETQSNPAEEFLVFIPDLSCEKSDEKLEEMIELRLRDGHHITATKVECHPTINIGVVHLNKEIYRNHLVERLRSIVLDPQTDTTIHFVKELEIISYFVLDSTITIPMKSEDITHRWQQHHPSSLQSTIEVVDVHFPNIFKITSYSLDELRSLTDMDCSLIHEKKSYVYCNANCTFLDNLPPDETSAGIQFAINASIDSQRDKSSIYIQYNKDIGVAIVLAKNDVRQWTHLRGIKLKNQYYMKQKQFSPRPIVQDVPHVVPSIQIPEGVHPEKLTTPKKQNPDPTKFPSDKDSSSNIGPRKHSSSIIKPLPTQDDDPEKIEIDGESWYETHMLAYEPDLMQFINDLQHPIFHYKWNSQSWLKQFQSYAGTLGDEYDKQRRLLRVTVMLNTIGILRKKSYTITTNNIEKKIQLNLPVMKTIVYNHQSKLSNMREVSSPFSPPYSSTVVRVVNEDCLIVYQKLASKGYRPVLMNMANADTPGGGYRRGAAAQEENLFRRSNYYRSLDAELDTDQQSQRYRYTGNCQEEALKANEKMYPIDEFGAIYTSGITVFRDTEETGYALLEEPTYNVCSIASAAYSRPQTKSDRSDRLRGKVAVNTRKKLENFFAIAHHHKHDCLVLSAYGCGAFRNPPDHIALIFKTVIEQYAGYFKRIYFSIIDDTNTGNQWNPDGNFRPFQSIFKDMTVEISKQELDVDMNSGPFRIVQKHPGRLLMEHVKILDQPPCQYSALCRELHVTRHCKDVSHPPLCPQYQSCDQSTKDDVHLSSFIHPRRSVLQIRKNSDQQRPLTCPDGYYCILFHDKDHFNTYLHPFRTPCPLTPFVCSNHIEYLQMKTDPSLKINQLVEDHCRRYAHVCPLGRQCIDTSELHMQISIHIRRQICSNQSQCDQVFDEDHFNSFTHLQTNDIRTVCKQSNMKCCERFNRDHLLHYRHIANHLNHMTIVQYQELNKDIDFIRNQNQLLRNLDYYIKTQSWRTTQDKLGEITDWIRTLQPIYRCNTIIFESVLVFGHVMSRKYMQDLNRPQFVTDTIVQHPPIKKIIRGNAGNKKYVNEFILALVQVEFSKNIGYEYLAVDEPNRLVQAAETQLKLFLPLDQINAIQRYTVDLAQLSLKLQSQLMDIGNDRDQSFGVDRHVCGIFGPNLRHEDGDIFIVFKNDIMLHPDSNFSIRAPPTYGDNVRPYENRPWLDSFEMVNDRRECFRRTQLHCSVTNYDHVAAMQLMALTGMTQGTLDVSLEQVQDRWMSIDPNEVFQAHLPNLIPLNYIAQIYMPKNIFDSLPASIQQTTKEYFSGRLVIMKHSVDANENYLPGGVRQLYERNVHDDIRKRVLTVNSSSPRGIMITLPVAHKHIPQYIHIPLTISESIHQYNTNTKRPTDNIFIYWQALSGDMTLIISEYPINFNQNLSTGACLSCYIADISLNNDINNYQESYSYITNNSRIPHEQLVKDGHAKAKSDTFHRGCNIYDYITYCLVIKRNTGEVTLTHAGANSIYNHQKISYTFQSSELDLTKLEHIQIGARNDIVSIRNFLIRHEPIEEYHPSTDKHLQDASKPLVPSPKSPALMNPYHQKSDDKSAAGYAAPKVVVHQAASRTPCVDSIYCLRQFSSENSAVHNSEYSHPCRYSEKCRNQSDHPHLTHHPNKVPLCSLDQNCPQLTIPLHRAQFRHTNLPDFLIPCRDQMKCKNNFYEHRVKYSHGEPIPNFPQNNNIEPSRSSRRKQ